MSLDLGLTTVCCDLKILQVIISVKILFPNKIPFTVWGVRTWTYFQGPPFNSPYQGHQVIGQWHSGLPKYSSCMSIPITDMVGRWMGTQGLVPALLSHVFPLLASQSIICCLVLCTFISQPGEHVISFLFFFLDNVRYFSVFSRAPIQMEMEAPIVVEKGGFSLCLGSDARAEDRRPGCLSP